VLKTLSRTTPISISSNARRSRLWKKDGPGSQSDRRWTARAGSICVAARSCRCRVVGKGAETMRADFMAQLSRYPQVERADQGCDLRRRAAVELCGPRDGTRTLPPG